MLTPTVSSAPKSSFRAPQLISGAEVNNWVNSPVTTIFEMFSLRKIWKHDLMEQVLIWYLMPLDQARVEAIK